MSGSRIPYIASIIPNDWNSVLRFNRDVQKYMASLASSDQTYYMVELFLTGSTASRLLATDASQEVVSTDLVSWVTGTANEIDITDDADGTITIGIVNPLIVGKGGTGVDTLTDGGLLVGSGAGAVTCLAQATDGQLPIGSTGLDPVLSTLTGTANQIIVTNTAGTITLSLAAGLGDIGGLTPTDSNFIVGDGANWVAESGATARTSIGLGAGDSVAFVDITAFDSGTPSYKTQVKNYGFEFTSYEDDNTFSSTSMNFRRARGDSEGSEAAVTNDDWATKWRMYGWDGAAFSQYGGFIYDLYDVVNEYGKFVFYDYTGSASYFAELGPENCKIGDTEGSDYLQVASTNGDITFAGSAGFYPRRITQSAEPVNGTGATQVDVGELILWRDPDDNRTYAVYNDTDEGVRKVELISGPHTTRITSGPYSVLSSDHVILVDTDGGAVTVNLPAGVEGTNYKIVNVGSSGNDAIIDPNGTEQLYAGGAGVSFDLIDGEVINIHYNATEGWW